MNRSIENGVDGFGYRISASWFFGKQSDADEVIDGTFSSFALLKQERFRDGFEGFGQFVRAWDGDVIFSIAAH